MILRPWEPSPTELSWKRGSFPCLRRKCANVYSGRSACVRVFLFKERHAFIFAERRVPYEIITSENPYFSGSMLRSWSVCQKSDRAFYQCADRCAAHSRRHRHVLFSDVSGGCRRFSPAFWLRYDYGRSTERSGAGTGYGGQYGRTLSHRIHCAGHCNRCGTGHHRQAEAAALCANGFGQRYCCPLRRPHCQFYRFPPQRYCLGAISLRGGLFGHPVRISGCAAGKKSASDYRNTKKQGGMFK